jgi:hypothetical protein
MAVGYTIYAELIPCATFVVSNTVKGPGSKVQLDNFGGKTKQGRNMPTLDN